MGEHGSMKKGKVNAGEGTKQGLWRQLPKYYIPEVSAILAQDKNITLHLYGDGIQPGLLNVQVAPKTGCRM